MSKQKKPCKVLMLIENLSFPWDRRMRHLGLALQQGGYEVRVICPKGENQDGSHFEIFQGIKVYRYPMIYQASGGLGYLVEYSWALVCTAFLSLYVWLRDGFDIIHSANPPDIFFILAWPFKLLGKKYVYDQHDVCPELYESKFERRGIGYHALLMLEQFTYRTADLIISTNESYREIARQRGGVEDERSAIVRNGVDRTQFYRRTPRPELKETFPYMALYLGVMGKQDGVDRVIQTAYHLVHTYKRKDVLFLMVGKGECFAELQDLSRRLEVSEVVRFVGRIPDDLLLDYLSTTDVCLAPDPPDQMNQLSTMTKIMEYMACERPIVSFNLVETKRSAADSAVYVEGEDPKDFARALSELLDDAPRRERMGRVGLDRTVNVVGLDRQRKVLLDGYRRLRGISRSASEPSQQDVEVLQAEENAKP